MIIIILIISVVPSILHAYLRTDDERRKTALENEGEGKEVWILLKIYKNKASSCER